MLNRHRLHVGLQATSAYVHATPDKAERCRQHDFLVLLQSGVPMTTPELFDRHLLEYERRGRAR